MIRMIIFSVVLRRENDKENGRINRFYVYVCARVCVHVQDEMYLI